MSRPRNFPVSTVAAEIIKNVKNIEEVNFVKTGPGSLFQKIAKKLKIRADEKLRGKLRRSWESQDSDLRLAVADLLTSEKSDQKAFATKCDQPVSIKDESNSSAMPEGKFESKLKQSKVSTSSMSVIDKNGNSYDIVDVGRDGNCLFRCLSHYVFGNEEGHAAIRKRIVGFVVKNWEEEKAMLLSTCDQIVYKTAKEYEATMGSNGSYGTDYEIGVFVRLYGITVSVFQQVEAGNGIKILQTLASPETTEKSPVQIMFTGNEASGHWMVLKAKSSGDAKKKVAEEKDSELNQDGVYTHNIEIKRKSSALSVYTDTLPEFETYPALVEVPKVIEEDLPEMDDVAENVEITSKKQQVLKEDEYLVKDIEMECPTNDEVQRPGKHVEKHSSESTPARVTCYNETEAHVGKKEDCNPYKFVVESDEASSHIDDDLEEDRVPAVVARKPKKRVQMFTEYIDSIPIIATELDGDGGYCTEDTVRAVIELKMWEKLRCTCTLGFYGSVRFNRNDIVAYARCRKAEHEQRFLFRIDHLNDPVVKLHVTSTDKIKFVHSNKKSAEVCRQLRGEERKKVKKEIASRSITEYQSEVQTKMSRELKEDGHMQNLRHTDVLYKLRSEEKCKDRLKLQSSDLSDLFGLWIEDNNSKYPFLRHVSLPLSAIMYSERDFNEIIKQKIIILHLDATGSVVREPEGLDCKRIFYYCLLAKHDDEIIKLAHMITSEHGIVSISTLLKQYKYFVMGINRRWPFAKAVVVDWSWASIHSILHEWNLMTVTDYLNIMYQYCKDTNRRPNGIIILKICYAHFMKIVSKTIHDKFYEYKPFKVVILECIALLCISRSLRELDELFKHICTLFLCRSEKTANDSMCVIKNLSKRNSGKTYNAKEEENFAENAEPERYVNERNPPMYRTSKFFSRYSAIVSELKNNMRQNNDSDDESDDQEEIEEKRNRYYAPKFVEHLLSTWMPYAIFWTALDLDLVDSNISRVSNAFIESSHRVMKKLVFKETVNSSIADRIRQLKAAHWTTLGVIKMDANPKATKTSRRKPKYPETVANPHVEENWQKGSSRGRKRKMGHVAIPILKKLSQGVQDSQNNVIDDGKNKTKKRRKNIEPRTEMMADKVDNDIVENMNKQGEFSIPGNIIEASSTRNNVEKFFNGLVKDLEYYKSESSTLTIGRYHTEKSVSFDTFEMTAKEFSTLRSQRWINGVVIDSFAASNIDEWIDTTLVPTDDTSMMLGDFSEKRIDRSRRIYTTNKPIGNKILMPYLYQSHWRLLVANREEETLTLLDPYADGNDKMRVTEVFKDFISLCSASSSFTGLKKIEWKDNEMTIRPYQPHNDGYSCGSYVMYYMDRLGRNERMDMSFVPSDYRREISHNLLLKSDNMESTCVHCFAQKKIEFVRCKMCERICHKVCVFKSEVDTDDEESAIKKSVKNKHSLCQNIPKRFMCKLCRKYNNNDLATE